MTRRSRREFLKAGGLALAGLGLGWKGRAPATARTMEVIDMRSDATGSRVWFDPIGLYVEPGTTVRWIVRENVHATAAYHPDNGHSLRIPATAVPWDSGYLVRPGDHFEVTLTVPGVYDYYCLPHEAAGMVGRIVVGQEIGANAERHDERDVPAAALAAFPSVARILAERRVHHDGPAPRR